jgi:hypothetical protein
MVILITRAEARKAQQENSTADARRYTQMKWWRNTNRAMTTIRNGTSLNLAAGTTSRRSDLPLSLLTNPLILI